MSCDYVLPLTEVLESDTELLDTFMPVDIESDSRLVNDILGIIKTCQAHHTLCPSISNLSLLPCRVIDVRSPGQNPSLHISHKNETGTYLALSYCWGGPQRVMLTRTSQATMQREISFVSLPKTVREAIAVCRALNYQYIWIDSLCIVQDCEEDKATQINAMGTIFAQAALTIMASNTPSVELGFLNQARPSHSCDIPFLLPNGETIVVRCSLSPPSYTNDANPTSRRGWIFQEDVLSVRELQFQSMSIRWVCGEKVHNFTSSMRNYTPELKSVIPAPWTLPTKASYSEIEEWWQSLVMAYSSREFTFWGDRLPALSGIITYLKPMLGKHNTYLAGLWKDSMIQQLAWMRNPGYPLKTVQPVPTKRLAGPTWSWISISSIVSIPPNNPVLPNPSSAILVSCTIELMNSATPFGNVKEGILVLEACVAPGPREEIRSEISGKINIHWDCEENSQNPAGGDLMDIWLVLDHKDMTQGSRIYALILRPIGDGRFRRVAAAVVQQDIEHLVWPYPNNRQRITII